MNKNGSEVKNLMNLVGIQSKLDHSARSLSFCKDQVEFNAKHRTRGMLSIIRLSTPPSMLDYTGSEMNERCEWVPKRERALCQYFKQGIGSTTVMSLAYTVSYETGIELPNPLRDYRTRN